MAHSMTHDGAMFLSMVNVIRPIMEMLARKGVPSDDREWVESRIASIADGVSDAARVASEHAGVVARELSIAHHALLRGLRCREALFGAAEAVAAFDVAPRFEVSASHLLESVDMFLCTAKDARLDARPLVAARDQLFDATNAVRDSMSNRKMRDDVREILDACASLGIDGTSEEFSFENWQTLDREMSVLRSRAYETGQAVSWGEPLLDD